MPPRRLTAKTGQKHEMEAFAEKYDTLALLYGDPVEVAFAVMHAAHSENDREMALQAANTLMGYRYPRVKAAEGAVDKAAVMNFNVIMPGEKRPEVDVTPPQRPMLVITEAKK